MLIIKRSKEIIGHPPTNLRSVIAWCGIILYAVINTS
jgi:hypothetical protein